MNFQKKIVVCYSTLALFFSSILGIGLYYYMHRTYNERMENSLRFTSQQMVSQFNSLYKSMEQVTSILLADTEVRNNIYLLRNPDQYHISEINQYKMIINNKMNADFLLKNYYRVLFFNSEGVLIYSNLNPQQGGISDIGLIIHRPILKSADEALGKPVLTGTYQDIWSGSEGNESVFSMIRAIQGDHLGYIEVQQKEDSLRQIFTPPDQGINAYVMLSDGKLLFTSSDSVPEYLVDLNDYHDSKIYRDEKNKQLIYSAYAEGDIHFFLTVSFANIFSQMHKLTFLIVISSILICGFSLGFIHLVAKRLTQPIRTIRHQIEQTEITNLNKELHINHSEDEIQAWGQAYNNLLIRLSNSIEREKKLSVLQIQAQFNALQAQVNPHFLYNILNILASKGMENNDEVTMEICKKLALMLEYSTNTSEKCATLKEEIDYLKKYVYLMKLRYENKLEVSMNVIPEVEKCVLPKITIQQLVENSIGHGYIQKDVIMKIDVTAKRDHENLVLIIQDNGQGFSEESLQMIRSSMEEAHSKITSMKNNIEIGIGKLGIISLYSSLFLIYQDNVTFQCSNKKNGGAIVSISINLTSPKL